MKKSILLTRTVGLLMLILLASGCSIIKPAIISPLIEMQQAEKEQPNLKIEMIDATVANDYDRVFTLLHKEGASPNSRDGNSFTCLMAASLLGHVRIARLLLFSNADATLKDDDGTTALDCAFRGKNIEIIELLAKFNPPKPCIIHGNKAGE